MSLLGPRPPRRRIVFMLTPLVDVMFLLLIFFMLSSQTAPYSLLEIMAQGTPGAEPAPQTQPVAPAQGAAELLVSIARGYARFNGDESGNGRSQDGDRDLQGSGLCHAPW